MILTEQEESILLPWEPIIYKMWRRLLDDDPNFESCPSDLEDWDEKYRKVRSK